MKKIGIIRETRPDESRAPLVPIHIKKVLYDYPKLKIIVQPSSNRCHSDQEYEEQGAIINDDLKIQAEVTSQSSGIMAGLNLWKQFFINCNCDFKVLVQDGDIVNNNQIIAEIQGSANKILKYERTFLNLVSRMSGIATETNKYSTIVKNLNLHTIVACTRKTAPGLNYFDKEAVRIGGGDTHRYRLDDAVLIKDNHIFITNSIKQAVKKIKLNVSFTKKIEVETKSYSEVIDAVNSDVDIIRQGISYTIDSVLDIKSKLGLTNDEIYYLVGSDNLIDFKNWKSPKEILEECKVIVAIRPGFRPSDIPHWILQKVHFANIPRFELASTKIRARWVKGLTIRYMVTLPIWEYINDNNLYSGKD